MRIQTLPLPGWSLVQDADSKSNVTLCQGDGQDAGVLQMSLALYQGGPVPNPTPQDLERQAKAYGEKLGYGLPAESTHGFCALGVFGKAVFHPTPQHHFSLWFLSNGRDFVLATFVCPQTLNSNQKAEAQAIVSGITLYAPERQ